MKVLYACDNTLMSGYSSTIVYFITGRYQSVGLIKKKPTWPSRQIKAASMVFHN